MRREVQAFVAGGPLPDRDADGEEIDRRCDQLEAIAKPVTGEEARALVACFGPDDCYGVAWTLLHLIETGPNPVLTTEPAPEASQSHHTLWPALSTADWPRHLEAHTMRCPQRSIFAVANCVRSDGGLSVPAWASQQATGPAPCCQYVVECGQGVRAELHPQREAGHQRAGSGQVGAPTAAEAAATHSAQLSPGTTASRTWSPR
jgi:hypothetical protein